MRTCQTGTLVFHPPGEAHSEAHDSAVTSFNVEVAPGWLMSVCEFAGPLDQPAEFRGDEMVATAFQLFHECRRADKDSALAIESLTWEILAASLVQEDQAAGTSRPRWLRDARDLVDGRLNQPLTLRSVAKEAGIHPVHFAATFRRFHGCSFGEYFRRRRLEYARRQLGDPELSLAQIALDAGFADQSHLTRTFKRFTGLTPGQYRTFLAFKTH